MGLALTLRRVSVAFALALFATESRAVTFADGAHHVIDASNSFPGESVVVDDGPGGAQTTLDVLAGGEVATAYEAPAGLIARGRSSVRIAGGLVGNFQYGLQLLGDAEAVIENGEVSRIDVGDAPATGAAYLAVEGGLITGWVFVAPGAAALVTGGSIDRVLGAPASLEIPGGSIRGEVNLSGEGSFELSGGDLGSLQIASGVQARVNGGRIRGATRLHGLVAPSPRTTVEFSGGIFGGELTATDDADLRITGGVYNGNVAARRNATLTIVGREFNTPFGEVPRPGFHLIGRYPDGGSFNAVVSQDIGASARIEPDPLLLLAIDVRPLSSTNLIRLRREKTVRVAVLGSATAQVDQLDLASLRFAPGAAQEIHDLTRRKVYARHRRDWNDDGFPDLTLHFRMAETGLESFHDRACLEGTLAGEPFLACDAVQVRGGR